MNIFLVIKAWMFL